MIYGLLMETGILWANAMENRRFDSYLFDVEGMTGFDQFKAALHKLIPLMKIVWNAAEISEQLGSSFRATRRHFPRSFWNGSRKLERDNRNRVLK